MKIQPHPPDRFTQGLAELFLRWWSLQKIARPLILFALSVLFCSAFYGCAASSPRFKGSDTPPTDDRKTSTQPRFASKVREEEMREDDRKVDIAEVRDRFAAAPADERTTGIDRKKLMTEVLNLLGTPYASGSNDTEGIDCSAFTAHIYSKTIGRNLPRTTEEQYSLGRPLGNEKLRFGDLVFFNTSGQAPSHVGVFIGDDLFAHASVSFGVTISSLQSSYYSKRYIGARRIVE